ncbi:hypothetical protein [Thiohalocapsa halophila]|uniref:hypothetical protein n=1 Tax=Thiohalocapsa halophila TaxID=69359 RepID=UPI0019072C44|nr:hypothetical protein [Thiohalocapsa halophila]
MDRIAQPHDTFFRESFTRSEVARDFLRYVTAEGEQYRKQHPKTRHLPPVFPRV